MVIGLTTMRSTCQEALVGGKLFTNHDIWNRENIAHACPEKSLSGRCLQRRQANPPLATEILPASELLRKTLFVGAGDLIQSQRSDVHYSAMRPV